jgi:phage head maturation protease
MEQLTAVALVTEPAVRSARVSEVAAKENSETDDSCRYNKPK